MFMATVPERNARLAQSKVPCMMTRSRSTMAADQGKPLRRSSCRVQRPFKVRCQYSASCALKMSVSCMTSGSKKSEAVTMPSCRIWSFKSAYFCMGKRCPSGTSKT